MTKKKAPARAPAGKIVAPKPARAVAAKPPPDPVATRPKRPTAPTRPPATPAIPPILLEGDAPTPPPASGPGVRYALGPGAAPAHGAAGGEPGELPESYGTKRLLLTARDPHWVYAHWDLTREQQRRFNALSTDGHLVVRVYVDAVRGKPHTQVHVHPESRNWFVHVGLGGTRFVAELGYYAKGGAWNPISVSGPTLTPPDRPSDEFAALFETIPLDIPFEKLVELVRAAVRENVPLVEALQHLRAAGHKSLPTAAASTARQWTPAQEQALAEVVSMDAVRRVWIGSLEITELVRRKFAEEISSAGAAFFSQPGISSLGVASLASPYGGAEARQKGFWFNVNAELIIYGATEPDAQVTICGNRIRLRPDGSFSYRFALPDGQYELPAVAVSADLTDGRCANLRFSRTTEYRGDVGTHPQDPALKPPLPENVS